MSNFNDPNDPDYEAPVPGTTEPVREYVVREPDPVRRVVPAPVEVEPVKRPWWPWLLLLLLIPLLWLLFRGCRHECTALPTNVWTTQEQTNAYNAVSQWMPEGAEQVAVTNALRTLCNYRLEHAATSAAGNWWDGNRVANAFVGLTGFDTAHVTNLQNYVNTATWCRCS